MALLSAHKLKKSFGGRILFEDCSFELAGRDHMGFIGANGTGKTTLFQILLGEQTPDEGEVHRAKLLRIGALRQTPDIRPGESLYTLVLRVFLHLTELEKEIDAINIALMQDNADYAALVRRQGTLRDEYENEGGLTYKSRVRSALLGLGFTEAEMTQEASTLSGGQLNKAMLAQVLLSRSELLFLDEPTNHLDVKSVEWLEGYLKAYAGAFIVISHDRYFLDQVTTRTMELKNARLCLSNGNYTRHLMLRSTEQEVQKRHYYNTQREIKRIYGIVEQQRRWNRERNIKTAESKLKQIERLKKTLVEPEKDVEGIRFRFQVKKPGGNDVLIAENLRKSYYEKHLFQNVDLQVRSGDRVFLLGPNGCGKTTLLRILMGRESADDGFSYFGAEIEAAYYEQNMRSMQEGRSVLEEVWSGYPRMKRSEVFNSLARFLFKGDDAQKRVSELSGGEKARVQLLKLMLSGANLLLLDEPTNHLDIASREALEDALLEYEGAMIVVTHDRYLVNRLADRVLYIKNGTLFETVGGYDAFLDAQAQAGRELAAVSEDKPKNAYQEKKERQKELVKAKSAVKKLEAEIASREGEIDALKTELSKPEVASDYQAAGRISEALNEKKQQLEALYGEWEDAVGVMEEAAEE